MWVQAVIVCVMIFLVSFGGNSMQKFFVILVSMTNVAMTLPYMMIAYAFIPFKKNKDIVKPFIVYKSYSSAVIWTIVVMFTVGFANFFSIYTTSITRRYANNTLDFSWTSIICRSCMVNVQYL